MITNCIPVYKNAFQTWYQNRKNMHRIEQTHTSVVNMLDASNTLMIDNMDDLTRNQRPFKFLDFAKTIHNGKFAEWIVDDVKLLQNAIITFTLVFPYWIIFSQVNGLFVKDVHMFVFYFAQINTTISQQAQTMSVPAGDENELSSNLMSIAEHATIISKIIN